MPYDRDQVKAMIARSMGGVRELAQSVGKGESTTNAQHRAALGFWQAALSLDGDDALSPADAEFAQAQVDRLTAALEPPPMAPRRGPEAV